MIRYGGNALCKVFALVAVGLACTERVAAVVALFLLAFVIGVHWLVFGGDVGVLFGFSGSALLVAGVALRSGSENPTDAREVG
ncbi:MAG: hypothetical protein FWD57_03525 [Polyangiaceae bacterium]|nr:hypothetical protein [Polyangiaceae bacterium]